MKNIVIAGNLTKDAELRDAGSSKVLGFSVAVNSGWGDKKTTIFFDCSLWGKRGESLADMMRTGTKVAVSGDFSVEEYNGKQQLKIRADDVTLMGGGNKPAAAPTPPLDSEIPF